MSESTDPIDQAAQTATKRAHDAMFQGIVNGLFGGCDSALLQALGARVLHMHKGTLH